MLQNDVLGLPVDNFQFTSMSGVSGAAINPGIPVFDSTIGFGSVTSGGAGGTIVRVTSLADSGEGSLRWALEGLTGKRIVVFDVAGTITLKDEIEINGDVTVAGRTAPGEGITIEGARLRVVESDVIIQGLRVRPGDGPGQKASDRDAISIGKDGATVSGVIIDGNSFTWATDEVVATWGAPRNISITNNIIAEALDNSIHPEGAHSMGMLLGDGTRNVTVMGNLFASNQHRNPQLIDAQGVEFVNNVIYNYGDNGFQAGARTQGSTAHLIGNVFIAGPDSSREPIRLNTTTGVSAFYLEDNIGSVAGTGQTRIRTSEVFDSSDVVAIPSSEVFASVLANAGARNAADHLDSIDARIADGVIKKTGHIVDEPPTETLVIDYPEIVVVPPPVVDPTPVPEPLPDTDASQTVHFEADDLVALSNMAISKVGSASEGTVLQANNTSLQSAFGLSGDLAPGVYEISVVYFDEADGASKLALEVNGSVVDAWIWDAKLGSNYAVDQTRTSRTISNVEINAGDEIRFVGQSNGGEPMRIDAIDVSRTGNLPVITLPETSVPQTVRLEADDLVSLSSMAISKVAAASEGTVLQATSTARQSAFGFADDLAPGVYEISVVYFDEADGASKLALEVNGNVVDAWIWDAKLGSNFADAQTRTSRTISNVEINAGDEIRFVGQSNGGEPMRIDAIDVSRTGNLPVLAPLAKAYKMEMEDATKFTNMRVERNGAASGGETLTANGPGPNEVEFEFVGASKGQWDMRVDHFDEADGISTLRVSVNGQDVGGWNWNQKLGDAMASSATLTSRTIEDLDLTPGDTIRFSGQRNSGEAYRLDAVSFVPDADFFG